MQRGSADGIERKGLSLTFLGLRLNSIVCFCEYQDHPMAMVSRLARNRARFYPIHGLCGPNESLCYPARERIRIG